jgi:hypothetical protein
MEEFECAGVGRKNRGIGGISECMRFKMEMEMMEKRAREKSKSPTSSNISVLVV